MDEPKFIYRQRKRISPAILVQRYYSGSRRCHEVAKKQRNPNQRTAYTRLLQAGTKLNPFLSHRDQVDAQLSGGLVGTKQALSCRLGPKSDMRASAIRMHTSFLPLFNGNLCKIMKILGLQKEWMTPLRRIYQKKKSLCTDSEEKRDLKS